MSDTKHEFDPNWPHGYDCILGDGTRLDAKIRVSDLAGHTPIAAEITSSSGHRDTWLFSVDGACSAARLVNRPAPEPVVRVATTAMNCFDAKYDNHVMVVMVNTRVEFLSDGTVRASAEVVK